MSTAYEAELIGRLRQAQRPAFDELVEAYKHKGFAICYNLIGNVEDTKDVLQETFIKVYLNIKSFKEKSSFSTWFYRIAVNCSLDFLRRQKKTKKMFTATLVDEEGKEKDFPDTRYEPAKVLADKETADILDSCIAKLPEKQRLCFILKHQNGLNNQEIAAFLKCSVATVKVHLFRAVNTLQDKLSGYPAR